MSSFEKWMREDGLSESSVKKYRDAISGPLTEWAKENRIVSGSLMEMTDTKEFLLVQKEVKKLAIFRERDVTGHHMYSSALKKYAQYLDSYYSIRVENDIESIIASKAFDITEKISLVKARIGQGYFRRQLIDYWECCSVTGCRDVNLLVASHIKPWSQSNNQERVDQFNGLLLLPNLDRAFDLGYITFDSNGHILISAALENAALLGVSPDMKVALSTMHKTYMEFHRAKVFKA